MEATIIVYWDYTDAAEMPVWQLQLARIWLLHRLLRFLGTSCKLLLVIDGGNAAPTKIPQTRTTVV